MIGVVLYGNVVNDEWVCARFFELDFKLIFGVWFWICLRIWLDVFQRKFLKFSYFM